MPHIKGKGQGRAWRESAAFPGHGEESAGVGWAGEHFTKVDREGAGGDEQGVFRGGGAAALRPGAAAEVTDVRGDWTVV